MTATAPTTTRNVNSSAPNLLREAEAAARLGLAPKTLARWRWRGDRGPAYVKLGRGGAVRYDPAALEAFIARGEVAQ